MYGQPEPKNAVAAIRVSSVRQGTQGDSPEAQKEQIEQFAATRNIIIKKFFVFLESASKEQQPMQEAIDYCQNSKNNIQLFIIKSIDRFTRGGSYSYDHLKLQLDEPGVRLVDIYGIISAQKVNTLEHLGVEYKWSVYSPTQKAEILEAERARDEIRDIMSRMIGAQIRYARMGYWIRRAPYGFVNSKVETPDGKRTVLKPEPAEAPLVVKMFELRARGTMDDRDIVDYINKRGFKSRIELVRDKDDRTKVVRERGGRDLSLKALWYIIQNPVYAGVNDEKWMSGKAIGCKFDGLVSVALFNKANRGKIVINRKNGEYTIIRRQPEERYAKKGVRNPDFPYKRIVMCPQCERPLFGSASRGKLGKYYPAYHCNKRGHYFRVPKGEFDKTIEDFVKSIMVAPRYIDELEAAVLSEWDKRVETVDRDSKDIDTRLTTLKTSAKMAVDKIKYLNSETAIKYMEEELMKTEQQIEALETEKDKMKTKNPVDLGVVMKYVRYFLEHLEYLLLQQVDPVKKAAFFGVIFDKPPTYTKILSGTHDYSALTDINEVFRMSKQEFG